MARKPVKKKRKSTNGCLTIAILLATLVGLSLAATFYFLFLRSGPTLTPPPSGGAGKSDRPAPSSLPPPAPKPTASASSRPAVTDTGQEADSSRQPLPPAGGGRPRIAIIIDDIGNTNAVAEQMVSLDLPLAFSIMPHTPKAAHLAGLITARNRDLLIHVPMEADEARRSSGIGMLLLSMTPETLTNVIEQDLDAPYRAIGVNNHMGSKFTRDPDAMRVFLKAVKARNMFFVDSMTAADSTGYALARDLGVKTAKRDIFLDNDQNPTRTLAQIGRLIAIAQRHGSAIGIGHPYPTTLEALRSAKSRLASEVEMVPIRELVN